jgi:hypothetical protein
VPDEDTPRSRSKTLAIAAGCVLALAAVVVGILVLRG